MYTRNKGRDSCGSEGDAHLRLSETYPGRGGA
jgi:hypothetical protein